MNLIETAFEWLLATTLRASALAAVILGLQFLLRRWLPAGWRHALWLPMLAVLVLPVLPTAPFGLFPSIKVKPAPAVSDSVLPAVPAPALVETASPAFASEALPVFAMQEAAQSAPAPASEPIPVPAMPEAQEPAPAIASAPVVAPAIQTAGEPAPGLESAPVTTLASKVEVTLRAVTPMSVLALVWFTVACGVLAAGLIGYLRTMRKIRSGAVSPDAKLQAAIDRTAREAGLRRVPQAWISPQVSSPAVTGLLRPVLLLPAGFPRGFQAGEVRLVLLHEFSHLKRLDLPLNWLACVLQAMHWFNPLLWFAFARMRADRELACDARVLSIDAADHRAEYGGALLKLQGAAPPRALSLGFVGIFERGSEIKSRIREIASHRRSSLAWQAVGAATLTVLMLFGVTKGEETPATDRETPPEVDPAPPVNQAARQKILEKLRSIIIPSIQFENVSIEEAVDFLRARSAELDTTETDPQKKGINFVILTPAADANIGKLNLRNVSIGRVLQYICQMTDHQYTVDDSAVMLRRQKATTQTQTNGTPSTTESARNSPGEAEELAREKAKLDFQIASLDRYQGDTLLHRAAAVDLPDNAVTALLPAYIDAKQSLEAAQRSGLGDNHPEVLATQKRLAELKRALDEEVNRLRASLRVQRYLIENRLEKARGMDAQKQASPGNVAPEKLPESGDAPGAITKAGKPANTAEDDGKPARLAPDADQGRALILGAVQKPGQFDLNSTTGLDLATALAMAGGLSETADPEHIELHRASGASDTFKLDDITKGSAGKIRLVSGDRIVVRQSRFVGSTVTILGHVNKPGPIPFPINGKLDIITAIAAVGGFTDRANPRKISINRRGKALAVDYSELVKGGNAPFMLEPGDIITVPERLF